MTTGEQANGGSKPLAKHDASFTEFSHQSIFNFQKLSKGCGGSALNKGFLECTRCPLV
jgi:hypothetical protein